MATTSAKERLKEQKELKTGIELFLQKAKNIWNQFKRSKTGLMGLIILLILAIMAVAGIAYKGKQSLSYGDGPRLASPIWTAPFDNHQFKYGENLIETSFKESQRAEDIFSSIRTASSPTVKNFTGFSQTYTQTDDTTSLSLNFWDKQPTQRVQNKTLPLKRKIALSKTIDWGEKRPPNGIKLNYRYSLTLDDTLNTSQLAGSTPYSISIGFYITSETFPTVQSMVKYLRERKGMGLSDNDYDKNGIRVSHPTNISDTGNWKIGNRDLPQRKVVQMFRYLKTLNLKFVISYQINEGDPLTRSPGKVHLSMSDVLARARGYYSGPMGTTEVGADLFSLIGQGVVNSLKIGLVSAAVTLSIGILLGLVSGWFGGFIDEFIMRTVDFLMVIPTLPLQIVLVVIFGKMDIPRVWGVVMALSLITWAGITRLIRSQVLSVKERPFIEAAQASGAPNSRIIFTHIFPNVIGLVVYQVVLAMQNAILATAALSFLGMGPEWVSFGNILQKVSGVLLGIGSGGDAGAGGGQAPGQTGGETATGTQALFGSWWFMFFPGLFLFLFGTGLIFVGMTLQNIVQQGGKK